MNCKVCGNTSAKNTSVSFFRFPKENTKCREWVERCDLLDLYEKHGTLRFYKSFRICSDHFNAKDIVFDGRKKRLLQSAIPLIGKIKNSEKPDGKNVVEDDFFKLNLCRLCATENKNLTDIFGWRGKILNLENKLKYFPLLINKFDSLPLKMCHECISKVNQFHDFILKCIKAERKLRLMLDLQDHDKSPKTIGISPEGQETSAWDSELRNSLKKTPNNTCLQAGVDVLPNSVVQFPENDFKKVLKDNFFNKDDTGCFCQNPQLVYIKTNQLNNHTNFIKEVDFKTNINFEHDYSNIVSRDQLLLESEIKIENDQNFMEETKHPCDICLESFCSVEVLNAHSVTHSVQPDLNKELICGACNKVFFSRFEFDEHTSDHLEKKYACKICDKKFHKVAFLEKHSLLHQLKNCQCFSDLRPSKIPDQEAGETPEPSLKCAKNKSSIFRELNQTNSKSRKTNSKTPKRKCKHCDKFKNGQVCSAHERSHTEDAAHQCKQCGKTFRSKPSLRQHRSVHSDKRLYSCQECGMSFKRKDTLSNHLRIHTGERPFVCKVCGFAFKQRGDCIKHEKNHQKTYKAELKDDLVPRTQIKNVQVLGSSTRELSVDISEINDGILWYDHKNSSLLPYITEEVTPAGSVDDIVPDRMPLNFLN